MHATSAAERIYSVSQLSEALLSGLMGLKDQLQVLSILDGSSTCWPGVSAAHADLEALVKLAGQHLTELDKQNKQLAAVNKTVQEQNTQLAGKLKATKSAMQQAQSELREQTQACRQSQGELKAAQEAIQQTQQQRWEVEKANEQLAQQAAKHTEEVQFLEGELAGMREHEAQLREQAAVQQEQLSTFRQKLAVQATELSHTSTALQEHKDSLAHTRNQLASVQDNLGGQLRALQRELSATQAEKLQSDRELGRLTQEVSGLGTALSKAETEVFRLKEWQDVFKRMAEDKAQEASQELQACKAQAAERQAAARGESSALQERLAARESQLVSLQQQLSLLQVHVREAQRVQGAAAEAQAAASKTLDQQDAELSELRQELKNAQLALERARADHLAAEASTRQAAATERDQLTSQLDQALCEVAVKQALCDGWQRANQALQDKAKQLEAAATAAADACMCDLRIQLESERAEARRAKMEATSTTKQYEQLVQRLRREADASAEEVCRLRAVQPTTVCSTCADGQAAEGAAVPAHIQQELMQLHRAMHTISGNLEVAEATMQQLSAQTHGNAQPPPQPHIKESPAATLERTASPPCSTVADAVCHVAAGAPAAQAQGTAEPVQQACSARSVSIKGRAAAGTTGGYSKGLSASATRRAAVAPAAVQKARQSGPSSTRRVKQ